MTKTESTDLNAFAKSVTSQYGEDGIISEILTRIDAHRPAGERHCVEFGAWDGKYLSNTYNLIANRGYRGVLIEADPARYEVLCKNMPQPSVTKINEFVTFDGATTLDGLLSKTDLPIDFDLLSIDIDGNDYHVLESLQKYRPVLICIEFNPTIPNEVEYVQARDFRIKRGASARAIASLAHRKGYAAVAATECNLFLLDRAYLLAVGLQHEPTLDQLRRDEGTRCYAFSAFDGTVVLSRPLDLPWHGVRVGAEELQALPAALRRFPDDYSLLQRAGFRLLRARRRVFGRVFGRISG